MTACGNRLPISGECMAGCGGWGSCRHGHEDHMARRTVDYTDLTSIDVYARQTSATASTMTADERRAAWAALRMIREAVGELFGPIASIESEEAVLKRGPEMHHEAEAIIAALGRVARKMDGG